MFEKSNSFRTKREITVTMTLADNDIFDARVFLKQDERLIDLLNDGRAFIPVRRDDGATIIVAKANILTIVERDGATADDAANQNIGASDEFPEAVAVNAQMHEPKAQRRGQDPYLALRVSHDASIQDIRRAYRSRLKAVHPDTLQGLDLDDEIARAALVATQKITRAYQQILRDRRNQATCDSPGGAD